MNKGFDIPIGIFFFNRPDLLKRTLTQISHISPQKIYLMSDGPRDNNTEDIAIVLECRKIAEEVINWPCIINKKYSEQNIGVYANIAIGSKYVFQQEECAIFLEDDNFPEISFFYYCKELLLKYRSNPDVIWICGNNFLNDYIPQNKASYIFTQHLHPCGWASWRDKFLKYYDFNMEGWSSDENKRKILAKINGISNKSRFYIAFENERNRYLKGERFSSWDFHMFLSILDKNLLGIIPNYNLIQNIGIDERATHGATRFSEDINIYVPQKVKRIKIPLVHPIQIGRDLFYDMTLYEKIKGNSFVYGKLFYYLNIKKIFGKVLGNQIFNFVIKIYNYLKNYNEI